MKFIFKETFLTDGSSVHDIQLIATGVSTITQAPLCIFSCTSEKDARAFLLGINRLVEKHTLETLEEA